MGKAGRTTDLELITSFLAVTLWWGWVWSGRVRDGRG